MKRFIVDSLVGWKDKPGRLPLIVKGARQVGKTYAIQEFGKAHFLQVHTLNFELTPKLKEIFKNSLAPEYLLPQLELFLGKLIQKVQNPTHPDH